MEPNGEPMMTEKYDAAPLVEVVEARGGAAECFGKTKTWKGPDGKRVHRVPKNVREYRQAKHLGYVSTFVADRLAIALDLMPYDLWPEW